MFSDQSADNKSSHIVESISWRDEEKQSTIRWWSFKILSSAFSKVFIEKKSKAFDENLTSLQANFVIPERNSEIRNLTDFDNTVDLVLENIGSCILREFKEIKPMLNTDNLFSHPIHSNLIKIKNKNEDSENYYKIKNTIKYGYEIKLGKVTPVMH